MPRRMKRGAKKRGGRKPRRAQQYGGRKLRQPVHFFTRTFVLPAQYSLAPSGAAVGGNFLFSLASLSGVTDFTTLYDQYCIKGCKVSLIPRYTEATAGGSLIGNMWSVIDYDDSTSPTNIDTVLQYQNVKRTRMNQIHSRYFKPQVNTAVIQSGSTITSAPKAGVWIDIANTAVEHRGLKFWFEQSTAGVTYDVHCKLYMAMKNVR